MALSLALAFTPMLSIDAAQKAYVSNAQDNTVSVIDLDTLTEVAVIPVGTTPTHVLATPDGSQVYVVNHDSGTVSVIATSSDTVIQTVPVGLAPENPAVSPDGLRVYVPNRESQSISVIETAGNTVETTVPTPGRPTVVSVNPVADDLWVGYADVGNPVLQVLSTADYSVRASLASFARIYGTALVFRPDGSELFVSESCGCCGRFHRLSGNVGGGTIVVTQPDIWYDDSGSATGVRINPIDGTVYLAKQGQCHTGPRVMEHGGLGRSIAFPSFPNQMAVTSAGDLLLVVISATAGYVSLVDTASFSEINAVAAGQFPWGIALVEAAAVNQPPIANAGEDQTVECLGELTPVTLSGVLSSDPDGDSLTFEWSVPVGSGAQLDDPSSPSPQGMFPVGPTLVTLTVTDGNGGVAVDDVLITVQDTTPPVVTCTTDKIALWPPNHAMIPVGIIIEVTDACSTPETLNVVCEVTSSEPDDGSGDGTTTGDVNGQDGFTTPVPAGELTYDPELRAFLGSIQLRAQRDGAQSCRIYSITCSITDHAGNTSTASCAVVVPHDKRKTK